MKIIVFDFDDTLFPSTFTSYQDLGEMPEISASMLSVIDKARSYCDKIYIITNAKIEWIDFCNEKSLNIDLNVEIISTVDQGYNTHDISCWKTVAFVDVLKEHFLFEENHELISFGDCPNDRKACMNIKKVFPYVVVKNVLMLPEPSTLDLLTEHRIIEGNIRSIAMHDGDLDIKFKIK